MEQEPRFERPAALLAADDGRLWDVVGGLLWGEPEVARLRAGV